MHPRHVLDVRLLEQYGAAEDAVILAAPLTDHEWAEISGSAGRIAASDHVFVERVLRRIVQGRRTYLLSRRRTRVQPVVAGGVTGRAAAVAALLVSRLQSPDDPAGIGAFRREVLHNRVRAPRSIARWIKAQQQFGDGHLGRTLAYRVPSSEWTQYVATRAGGTLERLRVASERTSAFTGWRSADATVFILTGVVPTTSAVQAEVRYQPTMSVRSRIVLTVDPTSTPAEVAAAYRRFRGRNFGRVRRLSAKHTALAHFAIEHAHLSALEQMTRWNAGRRQGRYGQLKEFTRDCQQALRRLADPLRPPQLR